jgi:hypothetical protein
MLRATSELLEHISADTYGSSDLIICPPRPDATPESWIPLLVLALMTNTRIAHVYICCSRITPECWQALHTLRIDITFVRRNIANERYTVYHAYLPFAPPSQEIAQAMLRPIIPTLRLEDIPPQEDKPQLRPR